MMRGSPWHYLPALFLSLILTIVGERDNLVENGDFEGQHFDFEQDVMMELSASGLNDNIPMWKIAHGGVQILDAFEYHVAGNINGVNGSYICHLNYRKGPGVLQTKTLSTLRKGAPYTVSFLMADNPDGGPLYKSIRVKVLVNDRDSSPRIAPFTVSNPFAKRGTIVWNLMSVYIVGTGEQTMLQFESLTPGSYGPLIDNVTVSLVSIIENGSFENITSDLYARSINISIPGEKVLVAPDTDIFGWTVTSGSIKYVSSDWYYPSTDISEFLLHLNADFSAGTIASDPFSTTPGKMYKVLFDTCAYPDNEPPLEGYIMVSAYSHPGSAMLASRSIFLSAKGYYLGNLGWTTYVLEFKALEPGSYVEFASQMTGSFNGPFLDNVDVFEVAQVGHYTSVPRTYNAGKPPLRPSLWTTSVTIALAMCVFGHLISEIWSLHS